MTLATTKRNPTVKSVTIPGQQIPRLQRRYIKLTFVIADFEVNLCENATIIDEHSAICVDHVTAHELVSL